MSKRSCCVVDCRNTSKNSSVKFIYFPQGKKNTEQRTKWIIAVRRLNLDGTIWTPKKDDVICSSHFVDGYKSGDPNNPNYIPSIFPEVYKKKRKNIMLVSSRHRRYERRSNIKHNKNDLKNLFNSMNMDNNTRIDESIIISQEKRNIDTELLEEEIDYMIENQIDNNNELLVEETNNNIENQSLETPSQVDKMCQIVTDAKDLNQPLINILMCNRVTSSEKCCNAETQTDIYIDTEILMNPDVSKFKDQETNTEKEIQKEFSNACVQTYENSVCCKHFKGYDSITDEEKMLQLAGVSLSNFKFLLVRTKKVNQSPLTAENRLLIFLMKLKLGLSYAALGVLYSLHRTTVSRIFKKLLIELYNATKDCIFWPTKLEVIDTMPECFKPNYEDVRIILDCTEFKIETPDRIDHRLWCYSSYKGGYTCKVLIGITPAGFICLVSKVCGGRKSDSLITVESGVIEKLENDDVVLADKGFPEIKATVNESGKRILVVMPPFLEKKNSFTKKETDDTYNIASVRIHVERVMQRIRIYNILDKIPTNLFKYMDLVVHMCCVLVNLQPPIINADKD